MPLTPVFATIAQNSTSQLGHSFIVGFFLFLETGSHSVIQVECSGVNTGHCSLNFLGSRDHPTLASEVAEPTHPCHHTWLI